MNPVVRVPADPTSERLVAFPKAPEPVRELCGDEKG